MSNKIKRIILEYLLIIIGTSMVAISANLFLEPRKLVIGGFGGIAIIVYNISEDLIGFSIPLWLTNTVLNVPLFIVGAKVKGLRFLGKTIFATAFLSFALFATSFIPSDIIVTDILTSAVFGGVICGIGIGLVFRVMATTGGTDMVAMLIKHYKKHLPISKVMFALDAVIVLIGYYVFGPINAMYAIIAVFLATKTLDAVLEGGSFAKAAFIISDDTDKIAKDLMNTLDRGVTSLSGKGMYTMQDRNVLLCVVSSKEITELKAIVSNLDQKAFVIVADVREVLGEGFKTID